MPAYVIADTELDSEVEFPELVERSPNVPAMTFRLGAAAFEPDRWYHELDDGSGRVSLSLGRLGTAYVVRFHELADFLIERDSRAWAVTCAAADGIGASTVRRLLLDQVVPLLLNGQGRVALHASAVTTTAGTVAFAGSSGAGKSTLAAAFWAAGGTLVADDVLLLTPTGGRPVCYPVYPSIRLWRDAASIVLPPSSGAIAPVAEHTDKVRIALGDRDAARHPAAARLDALYLIDRRAPDAVASIETIARRDAFRAVLEQVYRLDPFDKQQVAGEMDLVHRIVQGVVIKRLRVPRSFDTLPVVRELVIRDLNAA